MKQKEEGFGTQRFAREAAGAHARGDGAHARSRHGAVPSEDLPADPQNPHRIHPRLDRQRPLLLLLLHAQDVPHPERQPRNRHPLPHPRTASARRSGKWTKSATATTTFTVRSSRPTRSRFPGCGSPTPIRNTPRWPATTTPPDDSRVEGGWTHWPARSTSNRSPSTNCSGSRRTRSNCRRPCRPSGPSTARRSTATTSALSRRAVSTPCCTAWWPTRASTWDATAARRFTPRAMPWWSLAAAAGYNGGYGKQVLLDHQFGYKTRYAHLSEVLVRPGDRVRRGQAHRPHGQHGPFDRSAPPTTR